MTAPFAPTPSPMIALVLVGILIVPVAMPFARREDWIGWIAFLAMAAAAVGLWSLLLFGLTRAAIDWWCRRPTNCTARGKPFR